jgi:hypothetical protein
MQFLVVTVCSNRKRVEPEAQLRASDLECGRVADVAVEWLRRIADAKRLIPANQLYCGRAFAEAVVCAKVVRGSLFVVSAGLGFVEGNIKVPSYSLSIVPGSPDSVLAKLEGERLPVAWWRQISLNAISKTFRAVLSQHKDALVLVALPSAYLRMVETDLIQLPMALRDRLRLFVYGGEKAIHESLQCLVMPYDNRLDGVDSPIRGTRTDFPQRAMRHFVETVLPKIPRGSAEQHTRSVESVLAGWIAPCTPERSRATDREIVELIQENWHSVAGQSGRMLRFLRDDLGVACEQGRLARLFRAVRAERGLLS